MKKLLFILLVFQASSSLADDVDLTIPDLRKLRPMNGINPAIYAKFWDKWELVTTRYRGDNGEQRFIYANDIAMDAMKSGSLDFPDGSVFGKVAFVAEEDPHFPNSYEPIDFIRLQIMVKDSKKFRKMDGWSYWLYVDGTEAKTSDDIANAEACHACHTLVKDRDFIFAVPSFIGDNANRYLKAGHKFEDRFRKRKKKDLNEFEKKVLALLPQKTDKVRSLRMRLFSGSLHESIGPLSTYSKDNSAFLLVDPLKKRFLTVQSMKPTEDCKKRTLVLMDQKRVSKKSGKKKAVRYVKHGIVCDGKNKWVKSVEMPEDMLNL